MTIEILRYLIAHPDAKDTVDGIRRWWIGPHGADPQWNREAVQAAIDALLALGFLVRRETTPSHVVYGLQKQHLGVITRLVKGED